LPWKLDSTIEEGRKEGRTGTGGKIRGLVHGDFSSLKF